MPVKTIRSAITPVLMHRGVHRVFIMPLYQNRYGDRRKAFFLDQGDDFGRGNIPLETDELLFLENI
jgi:hypothetical protein